MDHTNKKRRVEVRDSWSNPIEYAITLVGYCVGLGNILRFPYICLQNGGGAFLIPYFICLFVCGVPLFYLECCIGQSTRQSVMTCWNKFIPAMNGLGYSMILVLFIHLLEYQICITWTLYYLVASFTSTLPWSSCNNTWNTADCVLSKGNNSAFWNASYEIMNTSIENSTNWNLTLEEPKTAVEEYWENNVLELSSGIEEFGGLRWQLVLGHVIGYLAVYFCVVKGVKSLGKVVYVTALLPYVCITIFLIRAATLPGSLEGVKYYVTVDVEKLKTGKVWLQGFLQIFYSLGPGWGGLISLASFNKPNHPIHIEAIVAPIMNSLTSFIAAFAVFSAVGYLATKTGTSVDQVLKSGPGLSFLTYPEIAVHLPGGPFWSALFFVMVLLVALGSQIVVMQTTLSGITDQFKLSKKGQHILTAVVSLICMVGGLVFCSRAGMYIYQIVDWYWASLSLFMVCSFECLGICWIYGFDRFADDIERMTGRRPYKILFLPLWGVILPLLLFTAIVWICIGLKPPTFGAYIYPSWVGHFGITLASAMVVPMFLYIFVKIISFSGSDFRVKLRKFIEHPREVKDVDDEFECERLNINL